MPTLQPELLEAPARQPRSSPSRPPGARTAVGTTMVFLGPLAVTLLPPSLTLLVVHLAGSQDVALEPSSEQQLCSLREHPIVAFADLKPWVSNFTYPGARDFSQLALDPSRNQLIVGARNYLFRLSLANVSLLQEDTGDVFYQNKQVIQERRKLIVGFSEQGRKGGFLQSLLARPQVLMELYHL